ncbi:MULTISPECIES: phosphotransferase enzyme family protein [unclassified Variovorax]|uniref:phosphotransferase enzyme family protein n=1 Tax=unclassified Variovorax TaxID=663243 RepID=UPI003F46696E
MTVATAAALARPPTLDDLAQAARAALACYAPRYHGSVRLLSLSENATYAVRTPTGERFVLRLHRPGYHSPAAVRSELAWLAALRKDGLEVPRALPGADDKLLQQASVPGTPPRMAVLFDWIEGQEPDSRRNLQSAFERLGAINARLHAQARRWSPPPGFERLTWDHDTMLGTRAHWGDWRQAPHLPRGDVAMIEETIGAIGSQLAAYGRGAQRFGLIHADLRLANLLVDEEHTRVIDFDDCGFGWYLHDLASALSFHEHRAKVHVWIAHWLRGYTRVASLEQPDLDVIAALLVQRRLQLLAWTGTHAETRLTRSLGPDWVAQALPLCRAYLNGRLRFG